MNSIIEAQKTYEEEVNKLVEERVKFALQYGTFFPVNFNNFQSPLDFLRRHEELNDPQYDWNYPINRKSR